MPVDQAIVNWCRQPSNPCVWLLPLSKLGDRERSKTELIAGQVSHMPCFPFLAALFGGDVFVDLN